MKFNGINVQISPKAIIGKNVRIGDNTTIYDNVEIKDNCTICDGCVIGEPLNDYYSNPDYENPKTVIGENATIRSFTIIYAGCEFGKFFNTGHRAIFREYTIMGDYCSLGSQSIIQGHAVTGDYCRLHTNVLIATGSKLGSYIYIYPFVCFSNDPHPPSKIVTAPIIGSYSQIAIHSVVLPGVKIGEQVLIGANTTVTKDVPDGSLVMGNPGKVIGPVTMIKSKLKEGSHYPWMYNFDRGMPWEGIGYDNWLAQGGEKK